MHSTNSLAQSPLTLIALHPVLRKTCASDSEFFGSPWSLVLPYRQAHQFYNLLYLRTVVGAVGSPTCFLEIPHESTGYQPYCANERLTEDLPTSVRRLQVISRKRARYAPPYVDEMATPTGYSVPPSELASDISGLLNVSSSSAPSTEQSMEEKKLKSHEGKAVVMSAPAASSAGPIVMATEQNVQLHVASKGWRQPIRSIRGLFCRASQTGC